MEFAFSPDSPTAVFTEWAANYRVFELPTAKELLYRGTGEQPVAGLRNHIVDMAVGTEGRVVLSYADEMIRVRDKAGVRVLDMQPRPLGQVFDNLKFSRRGGWVVGRGPTEVRVWDIMTGKVLKSHPIRTVDLDLGTDDQTLVTIDNDHWIRIWDARTGRERSAFADTTKKVVRVKFSPDGRSLMCWCRGDQDLYLVDPRNGQQLMLYQGHAGNIADATFFPNDRLIASVGADRALRVWNKTTGAQLYQRDFNDDVRLVGVSPDGQYVVIVLRTETVFYHVLGADQARPKPKR